MKGYWIYIVLLAIVFSILIYLQATTPKPISWEQTFNRKDKIPYGTLVLFNTIDKVFNTHGLEVIDQDIYTFTESRAIYLEETGGFNDEDDGDLEDDDYAYQDEEEYTEPELKYDPVNIISIGNSFSIDNYEKDRLLNMVSQGSNLFVSAVDIDYDMLNELQVYYHNGYMNYSINDTFTYWLVNPAYRKDSYELLGEFYRGYFDSIANNTAVVLGENENGQPNFIKLKYGQGNIYLHTFPFAFTNIAMLRDNNSRYAYAALSYLPDIETFWDETGSGTTRSGSDVDSPLKFILANPALSWAYYILLFSLLLYVIFEGKRRQKIIPVIEPLRNTTVEFVETVGRLYFHRRDHKNLADKKISYFLEWLRTHMYMRTNELDKAFAEQLHLKTGISKNEISELLVLIKYINDSGSITATELETLNFKIDEFYRRTR